MPIDPWPVRRKETLLANQIFAVTTEWCLDPADGREHPFFILKSADWVNVVPVTAEGKVLLVEQWRFATHEPSIEVPGGIVDPGEDPAFAAGRELTEETGYVAGRIVPLGSVDPNPAILSNRLHIFAALACRPAEESERREQDHAERIIVHEETLEGCERMALHGRIRHACALAALHKYRLWKTLGEPEIPPGPRGEGRAR